jgi:hypothetical protein
MIEHAGRWTANLDQLAWSVIGFVALIIGIAAMIRWVRNGTVI